MATEEQLAYNNYYTLHAGDYAQYRVGQRLTISNRRVTHLSFIHRKEGSPTGNITYRIRRVSDDSIINEKILGDASALTTSYVRYEVTFDTPVLINEEVKLLAEYSGGDNDNKVWVLFQWSDVKADEYLTKYTTSYTEEPTKDCAYIYTYTLPAGAPAVTALPASAVTATTAKSNGEVTNTGGEDPTVHIYWGTSDGGTTPGNWDHDENLGALGIGTFYKDISGLTRGTKYYYRCYAENSGGSAWSNAVEFTTLLEKPVAASNAATGVGVTAATVNGGVTDDGGGSCQYRFRYKKAGGGYVYTDWTGAKTTGETFSEGITGLDASSTYYFNARVKNSQFESDWGAELTFNTGAAAVAPTGTTDPAALVADIEATLNGTVTDDGGEACEVRFQYGLAAPAYGTDTAWQPGKLTNDTFSQRISGLTPNTTYHFRAQIKNSAGTVDGADRTFATEYFPTPFIRRVLRDVFGGGADISAANPLQVYDPAVAVGVEELLNSAMVLTETGGTITTTVINTEYDVYINDDPAGEYRPEKVVIDFSNQTGAETTVIREYYRIKEGGDYIKKDGASFIGVQDPALINIELEPNRFGIKVTIERTAGDAKAYDWETHYAD